MLNSEVLDPVCVVAAAADSGNALRGCQKGPASQYEAGAGSQGEYASQAQGGGCLGCGPRVPTWMIFMFDVFRSIREG